MFAHRQTNGPGREARAVGSDRQRQKPRRAAGPPDSLSWPHAKTFQISIESSMLASAYMKNKPVSYPDD